MADFFKEIVEMGQDVEGLTSSLTNRAGDKAVGFAEEAIGGVLNNSATVLRQKASKEIDSLINELSGVRTLSDDSRLDFAYKISKGEKAFMYPLNLGDTSKYQEYMMLKVRFPTDSKKELFLEESPFPSRPKWQAPKTTIPAEGQFGSGGDIIESRTDRYTLDYGKETFIFLPMPDSGLVNRNEVSFNEESMGIVANVQDFTDWDQLKEAGSAIGQKMITKLKSALTGSRLGEAQMKAEGRAFNPLNELLLDSVRLRTWNFEYLFAPKNYEELIQALAILKIMKYSMLPGTAENKFLYSYPAEYDIVFRKHNPYGSSLRGGSNNDIFCATNLYCTAIETDYTPNGVWATFANGKPVQFKVTMSFSEITPQTRTDVIKED